MRKLTLTIVVSFLTLLSVFGQQQPVDVAELTLKVGAFGTEELYYGFAQGDQIVLNFEEMNGKELKELDVIELPNNSKFMDYKTVKIVDKKILVNKKAVYKFVFSNSAMAGRICKVKIQRIPQSETTLSFNTGWKWLTLYDTSYVAYTQDSIVGYDTTYTPYTKKELKKTDTTFTQLFDKTERVHSETNLDSPPESWVTVSLPSNVATPSTYNPYHTEENIAWSYFIGVGQEGKKAFDDANRNLGNTIAGAASLIPGYGALASLAIKGITNISIPSAGDNVKYFFIANVNGQTITFESGDGIAASGRNTKYLNGSFSIKLVNDNFRNGIDVNVKVIVMRLNKTWEDVSYQRQNINARKVTLHKQRRVIKSTEVRTNEQ